MLREARIIYMPVRSVGADALAGVDRRERLDTADKVAPIFQALLAFEPQEVLAAITLTTKLTPIRYHEISRGTLDATLVSAREVFRPAILDNAAGIILAHNHPSGCAEPSAEDDRAMRAMQEAGTVIGIAVYDALIVTAESYYSYQRAKYAWVG